MQYESNWLAHHGVKGQKWGVQNGPPYPLSSNVSTGKELKKIAKVANKHFKSNTIYDFAKKQNKKAIADIKKQGNVQNRVNSDQDLYDDIEDHLEYIRDQMDKLTDKVVGSDDFKDWLDDYDMEPNYYLYDKDAALQYLESNKDKDYIELSNHNKMLSENKFKIINKICDDICGDHMYEKISDFGYQSKDYTNSKGTVKGMTRATNAAVTQLLEENYQKKLDDYWYEEFDFSNNQWIRKR